MSFTVTRKVLFRDCDPAGIVFFPRYFEMINDVAEAWFAERLGAPWEALLRTHGVPTAATEAVFRAPSRHGDVLEIALTPAAPGRTSVALAFEARAAGALRFTARSTLVHVDGRGRPDPWPDALRARIAAEAGGPT